MEQGGTERTAVCVSDDHFAVAFVTQRILEAGLYSPSSTDNLVRKH